jgi:DNA polymerase-3 subunit delta
MLYVFDGDDDFTRREEVTALKTGLGPADMVSLNTAVFDGAKVGFEELRHACDSAPFFTDARLVIVEGLLARLQGPARKKGKSPDESGEGETDAGDAKSGAHKVYRERLLEYLPSLPASTHLIFQEPAMLTASNPFVKWLQEHPDNGRRKVFSLPNVRRAEGQAELADWIRTRAKTKGATIEHDAVSALVSLIGNDLRQMDSELEKLAVYCQGRAISNADVKELVSLAREAVVWDMVDAIAQKRLKVAMDTLRRLLAEGEPPLRIFGLIVREYRMLVQMKDLADQGYSEERIAARLGVPSWMLRQRMTAVRSANGDRLKGIYRMLLDVDVEIKTGVQEPETALEFLAARLCQS